MAVPHGRAPLAYTPGRWVAVVASGAPSGAGSIAGPVALLADLDPALPVVTACWDAVEAGGGADSIDGSGAMDALLGVILREGLRNVPSFAIAARTAQGYRVLVSGKARAEIVAADGTPTLLDAAAAPTWLERTVPGAVGVRLVGGSQDVAHGPSLGLHAGVVLAAAVELGQAGSGSDHGSAAAAGAAAGATAAATADTRSEPPSPPPAPAPPAEPPTAAAAPTAPAAPAASSNSGLIEALPWLSKAPAPPAAPQAGRPPSGDPADPPRPADPAHPADPAGQPAGASAARAAYDTGSRGSSGRGTSTGPLVLAVACPNRHLGPPYAGVCRVCGAPVAHQDPFSAPRPLLGVLSISTGATVPLDRDVVLGRSPSAGSGEGSAPQFRPHLVQLASPGNDISRNHVRISLEGWHVLVTDLGSTNGTVVTLPDQQPVRLRAHDAFTIVPGTIVNLADEVNVRFDVPK